MPEGLTAPCPVCHRTYPAYWQTFADGSQHLRVRCPNHPAAWAARKPEDRQRDAQSAPREGRITDYQ